MKNLEDKTLNELVDILFTECYYNTDDWGEVQRLIMSKMSRSKDFSIVATLIENASKREHYQLIEFIASHLNAEWCEKLWGSLKTLITCKNEYARYRGVWLHSFMAKTQCEYLEILHCLDDKYQTVRLKAYDWMINNSDIIFDMIENQELPENLLSLYEIYPKMIDMTFIQIEEYLTNIKFIDHKKEFFFMVVSKESDIKNIKVIVDLLDDQDIFDYFHRFYV